MVGRWPDHGYTLQYRPVLVEARQTPIDPFPEISFLGRIDESGLSGLRSLASRGRLDELSDSASRNARAMDPR